MGVNDWDYHMAHLSDSTISLFHRLQPIGILYWSKAQMIVFVCNIHTNYYFITEDIICRHSEKYTECCLFVHRYTFTTSMQLNKQKLQKSKKHSIFLNTRTIGLGECWKKEMSEIKFFNQKCDKEKWSMYTFIYQFCLKLI